MVVELPYTFVARATMLGAFVDAQLANVAKIISFIGFERVTQLVEFLLERNDFVLCIYIGRHKSKTE